MLIKQQYFLALLTIVTRLASSEQLVVEADILPICQAYADAFASAAAQYTQCFIANSRPWTLCVKCVDDYLKLQKTYHALETSVDTGSHDGVHSTRACTDWVLNADRVMAIQQTKQFYENLWTTSQCADCFESLHWRTGNLSWSLAGHYKEFSERSKGTTQCFSNYTSGRIPLNVSRGDESPCHTCKASYKLLNDYYMDMEGERGSDKMCMDIVDSMNYTRLIWGHVFNCTESSGEDGLTIAIALLFVILPVVFYVASYLHYQSIEKKIVKQNRMRRRLPSVSSHTPSSSTSAADTVEGSLTPQMSRNVQLAAPSTSAPSIY